MAMLIDAQKVARRLSAVCLTDDCFGMGVQLGVNHAIKIIGEEPFVDAVEVVRCGNCKHFREPFCIRRDDETHKERINMLSVDFCSYGERRTDA